LFAHPEPQDEQGGQGDLGYGVEEGEVGAEEPVGVQGAAQQQADGQPQSGTDGPAFQGLPEGDGQVGPEQRLGEQVPELAEGLRAVAE